jgi:hypothetical protein
MEESKTIEKNVELDRPDLILTKQSLNPESNSNLNNFETNKPQSTLKSTTDELINNDDSSKRFPSPPIHPKKVTMDRSKVQQDCNQQ